MKVEGRQLTLSRRYGTYRYSSFLPLFSLPPSWLAPRHLFYMNLLGSEGNQLKEIRKFPILEFLQKFEVQPILGQFNELSFQ